MTFTKIGLTPPAQTKLVIIEGKKMKTKGDKLFLVLPLLWGEGSVFVFTHNQKITITITPKNKDLKRTNFVTAH